MFEGKISQAGIAIPLDRAGGEDSALRPVSWSDLVARLDAARDLRAALRGLDDQGQASFDKGCARHIASLGDGKQDVNLDALANGKAPGGMKHSDKERGPDDVRGN